MIPALYIARRLSLRGGHHNRRPPSVWIAAFSVALTVVVLELTLSVVGGFREAIVDKVRGLNPDIVIEPPYNYDTGESDGFIELTPVLSNVLRSALPMTADVVLCMRYPAVMKTDDNFSAVVFNAFGKGHDFDFEKGSVVDGEWPDWGTADDNSVVISASIANSLDLTTGDKINCYFFVDGHIKARKVSISAIYNSNFGENDNLSVYASLPWLQKVASVGDNSGTYLEVRGLEDLDISPFEAEKLQGNLIGAFQSGELNQVYPVDNVTHTGAVFFNWLDLLDTNVIVVFILMACVAGFTLISSLFILILERIKTIGLLRSLGMTVSGVRNIFVYMALKYVVAGMVFGNIVGLGIIFAQKYLKFLPLNPDMYYLSHVPVSIDPISILWMNVGILTIAWLVMILPARLVATVQPSQTMQYE